MAKNKDKEKSEPMSVTATGPARTSKNEPAKTSAKGGKEEKLSLKENPESEFPAKEYIRRFPEATVRKFFLRIAIQKVATRAEPYYILFTENFSQV